MNTIFRDHAIIEESLKNLNKDLATQTMLMGYWLSHLHMIQKDINKIIISSDHIKIKVTNLLRLSETIQIIINHLEKVISFNPSVEELKIFLIENYKDLHKSISVKK